MASDMDERQLLLVTGVPGTGKTTVSTLLAAELGAEHIELTRLVREGGFSQGWDQERATVIADMKALRNAISNILDNTTNSLIIDGHYSPDIAPREETTLVVVLRCAPWVIREKLLTRGYSTHKVRENVEAELLGTCLTDALAVQDPDKVCEIDTTTQTPEETVKLVLAVLDGEVKCSHGAVDWMNSPEAEALLREL
ncbi:MAG: adenylate kinase family protein [Candidatus Bathyarchaeota archaeon]|nr:adenylate kinase family protein [Candidatus Bathyarchaeota archaeon]